LSPSRSGRQSKSLQPKKPTAALTEEAPSGHLFKAAGAGMLSFMMHVCICLLYVAYTCIYINCLHITLLNLFHTSNTVI
jgi:hypothetical protein